MKHLGLWMAHGLVAVTLAACAETDPDPPSESQPEAFVSELPLTLAEDQNPDPHVLEVELRARVEAITVVADRETPVWTYGGTIPGPLLRLTAGDRLIVHFVNDLPEATTIHWHGVRVPVEMDGNPHSQPPVEPGESFTYDFVVPDPGLFWYHPHVHDAAQLGYGLYGALLVDPADEQPADLGDEVVLVLSDIAIADDGKLQDPEQGGTLATLFGREGDQILVNGRVQPTMYARNGKRQRWRLVNAAKSRYFSIALTGNTLTRIGGHTGLLPAPEALDLLLLAPGERADVVVEPRGEPGDREQLLWIPIDRGYGTSEFRDPTPIMDVELVGEPVQAQAAVKLDAPLVEPISLENAYVVETHLTQATDADGNVTLGINGLPFEEGPAVAAAVGDTQHWKLTNEMAWDHPFHLHGFFFQRLAPDGSVAQPVEWLDTINVPQMGTAEIVVKYDNRPGMWMFHCHILDHSGAGMAGMVDLRP